MKPDASFVSVSVALGCAAFDQLLLRALLTHSVYTKLEGPESESEHQVVMPSGTQKSSRSPRKQLTCAGCVLHDRRNVGRQREGRSTGVDGSFFCLSPGLQIPRVQRGLCKTKNIRRRSHLCRKWGLLRLEPPSSRRIHRDEVSEPLT